MAHLGHAIGGWSAPSRDLDRRRPYQRRALQTIAQIHGDMQLHARLVAFCRIIPRRLRS
jgi:hypothetical protein